MTGTCLCGAVCVTIDAAPALINDCNCSLCRKSGGAWGYFPPTSVTATGETVGFVRPDKASPAVEIHSCARCAVTTHWVRTEAFKAQHGVDELVGVNMRLFDPDDLKGVEVHYPNGKDWSGEGPFTYRRTALTISDATPW